MKRRWLSRGDAVFLRIWLGTTILCGIGLGCFNFTRSIGTRPISSLEDWGQILWFIGLSTLSAALISVPIAIVAALIHYSLGFVWPKWGNAPSINGPSLCENCDYDLTGNTSGTCPECGSPTKLHSHK